MATETTPTEENLIEVLEEEGSILVEDTMEEVVVQVTNTEEPEFIFPMFDELATVQTVKIQGNGWLLNGTMSVPNADDNRDCQLIKRWLAVEGNIPEPEFDNTQIEAMRIAKIKVRAGEIILSRYSELKQRNVALGIITDETYVATMKAFITDIREQSNTLELDVTKTSDDFVVGE